MPAEHYRPGGGLAQGYYCSRCGAPGVNMYATGHGEGLCERNVPLVRELDRANQRIENPGRSTTDADRVVVAAKIIFQEVFGEDAPPEDATLGFCVNAARKVLALQPIN